MIQKVIHISKDTNLQEVVHMVKSIPTGIDIIFIQDDDNRQDVKSFINFPIPEIVKEIKKYKKEKSWKRRCY